MQVHASIPTSSSSSSTNSASSSATSASPQRCPCATMATPSSLMAKSWQNLLSRNPSAVKTTTCTSISAGVVVVACSGRFVPGFHSHPSLHLRHRSETSPATSIPPSITPEPTALTSTKSSSMSTTRRTSRFTPSVPIISMQNPASLPS